MSVESLAIVLHHSTARGTDKVVLVGIANHDGDGGSWPAKVTLAKYANVSVSSVERSLRTLESAGEIRRHINDGGTRATPFYERPNRYEILVTCPADCDRSTAHRRPVDNNPALPGLPPLKFAPPFSGEGTPPSTTEGTPPSVVEDLTVHEPSINSDQSPTASTSPEKMHKCWACGQNHPAKGSYCAKCSGNGRNSPWIDCTGCGNVRKRNYPGQQVYTCTECKRSKEALDDEEPGQ